MYYFYQKNVRFLLILLVIPFLIPVNSIGQEKGIDIIGPGIPSITSYSPSNYNAHRQNWAFTQDSLGLIYVGNTSGLLVYDGVSWQKFSSPNGTVIRSLAQSNKGQIYYGAKGDFGFIRTNNQGNLELVSLAERLDKSLKNFKDIWAIHCIGSKVFFQSFESFIQIDEQALNEQELNQENLFIWEGLEKPISFSSKVQDTIFFQQYGGGIYKWYGDQPEYLPGTQAIEEVPIKNIIQLNNQNPSPKFLITCQKEGLYFYENNMITPFLLDQKAKAFFKRNIISQTLLLSDNSLAISSYLKGLLIIDQKGNTIHLFDQEAELVPSDAIINTFIDSQNSIWLGTGNGIARIEYPAPISFFSTSAGIQGNVFSTTRHNGKLFVGSSQGLWESQNGQFSLSHNISSQCFDLLSLDDELITGISNNSLLSIIKGRELNQIPSDFSLKLHQSQYDPNLVFVGTGRQNFGFMIFYRHNGKWKSLLPQPFIPAEIRFIAEEAPGIVWLGSTSKGYFRMEIPSFMSSETFPNLDGIKEAPVPISYNQIPINSGRARVFQGKNRIYLGTNNGLKSFDPVNKSLYPDTSLGDFFADSTLSIRIINEDQKGNIWVKTASDEDAFYKLIPKQTGGYERQKLNLLNRIDDAFISNIYADPNQKGILWLGGTSKLIRYDQTISPHNSRSFHVNIRQVKTLGDSLLYGGFPIPFNQSKNLSLDYQDNNLRFEYASTNYDAPDQTQYQVFLEGFDDKWSNWTQETQKDYTNIPEGIYTFKVKAKNIYNQTAEVTAPFLFSVSPPWFRTWWSYVCYFLLGIGFIYLIMKWRESSLQKKNEELENIITSRTKELAQKNEQLKSLDEVKTRFFTNISHEIRTPLTIIKGMAEQINRNPEKWTDRGVKLIQRNSNQLLNLTNQILELRKLESGTLKLNLIYGDIIPYLRYIVESFHSLSETKDIHLHSLKDEEQCFMDYDAEKITRILSNLLSNAIKFTPEGGDIYVHVDQILKNDQPTLLIEVRDTGKGIPSEKLPYLFDRFYQIDDSSTRAEEGTGIGLALVKELVKMMKGQIEANSELGQGTTFLVQIPIQFTAQNQEPLSQPSTDSMISAYTVDAHSPTWVSAEYDPESDRPTILIIEDNDDVVEFLVGSLEDLDLYQIKVANNGQEGIEMALELIPDLIISDVMMPIKDGLEVCDYLKQEISTSHIPIILLTARADVESRLSGLNRGADAYLTKPFNHQELLIRVNNLLKTRLVLQERYRSLNPIEEAKDEDIVVEDKFILKIRTIIEENIDNEDFKITELCREIGLSRSQLHKKIKALTGYSTSYMIHRIRLEKAKDLLKNTELNISEIAYEVGYSDPAYFSRNFKEQFGKRPKDFREQF